MGVTRAGRDLAVDKHFAVPAGVVDVRQLNRETTDFYTDDPSLRAVVEEGDELAPPTNVLPAAPSTYTIVEEKVRITSDGRAVVDLVLDFPDSEGAHRIDVRVTKT